MDPRTHSRTTVHDFSGLGAEHTHRQQFVFDGDHPEVFASQDQGATPVETVLAALAGCLTAGVASVATNRGVQLRSVTATLEGDMDLQGILGIDPEVRNGFSGIRVRYEIDADASPAELPAVFRLARQPVGEADLKQARLLDRIDDHVARSGLVDAVGPPDRPAPVQLPTAATELDARRYDTVLWATGYRQHHPWLDAAMLDRRGQLRHDEGVTLVPGVYALGLPFLRQRRSGLLDGIGADAGPVAAHLLRHLAARAAA